MVLEPTQETNIAGSNNALSSQTYKTKIIENQPVFPYSTNPTIITGKTVLSSMTFNTRNRSAEFRQSGFTLFIDGVITKGEKHSCQGEGGGGCGCGGSCGGDVLEFTTQENSTGVQISTSPNRPMPGVSSLAAIQSGLNPSSGGQPYVTHDLGGCYEYIYDPRNIGGDVIEPGCTDCHSGRWLRFQVPCPDGIGIDTGGHGAPFGKDKDQLFDPPSPIDKIDIQCLDEDMLKLVRMALDAVFTELDGDHWKGLMGCSDKIDNFINCMLNNLQAPTIYSITCVDKLPGDAVMHTNTDGVGITPGSEITLDVNKWKSKASKNILDTLDTMTRDFMHEMAHSCGVKELDAQIMTMVFLGKSTIDNNLTWRNPIDNRDYHTGTEGRIKFESKDQKPDDKGFYHAKDGFFAWNPDTGDVKCVNSDGKTGKTVLHSVFPGKVTVGIISSTTTVST